MISSFKCVFRKLNYERLKLKEISNKKFRVREINLGKKIIASIVLIHLRAAKKLIVL